MANDRERRRRVAWRAKLTEAARLARVSRHVERERERWSRWRDTAEVEDGEAVTYARMIGSARGEAHMHSPRDWTAYRGRKIAATGNPWWVLETTEFLLDHSSDGRLVWNEKGLARRAALPRYARDALVVHKEGRAES